MDAVEQHRGYAPGRLGFAVLTVSDSRTPETDGSGDAIRRLAAAAGHRVVVSRIVPDEQAAVRAAVRELLAADGVDMLVASGGTGFAPRDVTCEAVAPLLERRVDGFGELFRMLSWEEIGSAAMLSRAVAGLAHDTLIFALPGSRAGVWLALEKLILPELAHLLFERRR